MFKELSKNIESIEGCFKDCGDYTSKRFVIDKFGKITAYVGYFDMLVNRDLIEQSVINRIVARLYDSNGDIVTVKGALFDPIQDAGVTVADIKEEEDINKITDAVMGGDTILMFDGFPKAIIISSKGWPSRGVPSADTEIVVQGSKEAFSEVFRINTMLIRRRIKDKNLKVKQSVLGQRSKTNVALMYMDDVVRKDILENVENRLAELDIDAISESGHLEQLIEDKRLSPFPQMQMTERPDKAASAILEGRIVLVVDNSPFVIILPCTLNTFFQSPEDYYQRFEIMSFIRMIRFVSAVISLTLPGIYLAITLYNPEMLPDGLILKMAQARQSVPLPAFIEIILMDLAFELLREAGVRLPSAVSGTIGIVGGLIVGQAAVEAGLVSPITVVIIALTGIAGFAIPNVSLVSGFRLSKYFVTLMSAFFGLLGFWFSFLIILVHLAAMESFGIPYLYPFVSSELNNYNDLKDSVFRMPSITLKKRPIFSNPNQRIRMRGEKDGQ